MRYRSMPVRNMRKNSDVTTVAETLKKNQRHRSLLKEISTVQIERLLLVIKNHLNGQTLNDSIEGAVAEMTVDPDLDLNKSKPEEVEKAKRIMDEEFYKKQVKVDDEDFQYDLEVDFGGAADAAKTSAWDSDDDGDDDYDDDF